MTAGWTLSTIVSLAIIYGLTPYLDESKVPEIDPAVSMTYGPLHRTAWAMVIAWIIFACSRGYGGTKKIPQIIILLIILNLRLLGAKIH